MNLRGAQKVARKLADLRRRPGAIRPAEVARIARKLGRTRVNRGKEPTYARKGWPPLTIPNHPGTLATGTALNIVNCLERDLEVLKAELPEEEDVFAEEELSDDEDGTDE